MGKSRGRSTAAYHSTCTCVGWRARLDGRNRGSSEPEGERVADGLRAEQQVDAARREAAHARGCLRLGRARRLAILLGAAHLHDVAGRARQVEFIGRR